MTAHPSKAILAAACCLINLLALGQRPLSVEIRIPKAWVQSVSITVDNGMNSRLLDADTLVSIKDTMFGKYASVVVWRRTTGIFATFHKAFFITDTPATVSFSPDEPGGIAMARFEAQHAYPMDGLGEAEEWATDSLRQNEFSDFIRSNYQIISGNDSLIREDNRLVRALCYSRLQFIKGHPGLYYSFWLFRTGVFRVWLEYTSLDSVRRFYESTFPKSCRESPEGQAISKVIADRVVEAPSGAPRRVPGGVRIDSANLADTAYLCPN